MYEVCVNVSLGIGQVALFWVGIAVYLVIYS
jgi:hypothetical protein